MSSVDSVTIDESEGSFTIKTLEIEDEEPVDFLSPYDSSEHSKTISQASNCSSR